MGCKGGNFLIFPFPFIVTVRAIMSEVYFVAVDKNVPSFHRYAQDTNGKGWHWQRERSCCSEGAYGRTELRADKSVKPATQP